jgi:hypothetical protein
MKKSDKTILLIFILAGATFFLFKYWMYLLAAVVLIGVAVAILYFRNPTFRFWLLSKIHKPKKTQEPEPPTRKQVNTVKPPPKNDRPKPIVTKHVILEGPADPKKLTNQQIVDEVISRGLGR